MNCPNCGAAMRVEEGRERLVCGVPMVAAAAAHERLLHCERCRGLLIPMRAFMAIVQELRSRYGQSGGTPAPAGPKALERRLLCPHCRQAMHTHPYGGPGNIVIDNCPRCAVNWLDHSELRRIVRTPEQSYRDDAWTLP